MFQERRSVLVYLGRFITASTESHSDYRSGGREGKGEGSGWDGRTCIQK